jgi:hypothetical protein
MADAREFAEKLSGGFHAAIAEDVCKGKDYQNICKVCGERSEVFGAAIFAHCLKYGWPKHCGQQMSLETVKP